MKRAFMSVAIAAALVTGLAPTAALAAPPPVPTGVVAAPAQVLSTATNYGAVRVTTSSLNVRTGASTAYPVTTVVKYGQVFTVLAKSNGWYKVVANGKTGWLSGKYTTTPLTSATTVKVVNASALNVRSGPSTAYAKVGTVYLGKMFAVVSKASNGWYEINYNNRSGWVSGSYVKVVAPTAPAPAPAPAPEPVTEGVSYTLVKVVNATSLNVRSGPSTAYSIIGSVLKDSTHVVLERSSTTGWYKVRYGTRTGWISGSYVTVLSNAGWPVSPGPSSAWPSDRPLSYSGTYDARNGKIDSETCAVPFMPTMRLHCRTIADTVALNEAYKQEFGTNLPIDTWPHSTYRTYADQLAVWEEIGPPIAARPGTSPHGWGQAIDFYEKFGYGTAQNAWLDQNGPRYGWERLSWHDQNGSYGEWWHFDYVR